MQSNSLVVRLLKDNIRDSYKHFAVEESILRLVDEDKSPMTLRIRKYNSSVWIGVNQLVEEDVDVEYCEKMNIPIVRRPNPGGAVYQDEGSFCFSFFFKIDELFQHLNIDDPSLLYQLIGKVIIDTCQEFGVKAELSGRNDVTIGGRKVYGSAQLQLYNALVHSGTFLVKTNIEQMTKTLRPSKLKFSDKGFTNIRDRVINFTEALNRDIELDDIINILLNKMAKNLNLTFSKINQSFTKEENKLIEALYKTKYSRKEWTFPKIPKSEFKIISKTKIGIMDLTLTFDEDKIRTINLSGDYLIPEDTSLKNLLSKVINKSIDETYRIINQSDLSTNYKECLIELFNKFQRKYQNEY